LRPQPQGRQFSAAGDCRAGTPPTSALGQGSTPKGASSLWVGLRGVGRDAEPDHDLARWSAPQTGQIAEEYSHGPCQEQPSSVPRFVGAGTGGLAARSGPARGRQPDVAGDAPGDGGSPWWSRNECRAGCSATLNSLMIRECQESTEAAVNHQPKHRQPSTEGQTSSISRTNTERCGWGCRPSVDRCQIYCG
jgi:hypothetical protein